MSPGLFNGCYRGVVSASVHGRITSVNWLLFGRKCLAVHRKSIRWKNIHSERQWSIFQTTGCQGLALLLLPTEKEGQRSWLANWPSRVPLDRDVTALTTWQAAYPKSADS